MDGLSRRGNALAAVIIIALLLAGVAVLTSSAFIARERSVDYARITSEIQNILDRIIKKSTVDVMQNGFSNETNVWYCNKPLPPNITEVSKSLAFYTKRNLDATDLKGFLSDSGARDINLSKPAISPGQNSTIDALEVNITNLTITVIGDTENRTLDASAEAAVHTRFLHYYQTLNKWMECNAGNLTQRVGKITEGKVCQFESCCCGTFPVSGGLQDQLKLDYGMKMADLDKALQESVQSLNYLFAGSDSCNTPATKPGSVVCVINESGTKKIVNNEIYTTYVQQACGSTSCEVKALAYDKKPEEWTSEHVTLPDQGCPNRTALPVDNGLRPDSGDPVNLPAPDGEASRYFMIALQREAAANILITCSAQDPNSKTGDQESFSIRVRVNVKNHCAPPPDTPQDTSSQACIVGGGGGAAACPCPVPGCKAKCDGGIFKNATPVGATCNAYCKMLTPPSCADAYCASTYCDCGPPIPTRCIDDNTCEDTSGVADHCPACPPTPAYQPSPSHDPGFGEGPGPGPSQGPAPGPGPGPSYSPPPPPTPAPQPTGGIPS